MTPVKHRLTPSFLVLPNMILDGHSAAALIAAAHGQRYVRWRWAAELV